MSTILRVGSVPESYFTSAFNDLILEAACPMEAVDLCRNHREVDVLISDMDLGLVSGAELASLLRAWIPNLRTILISDAPLELWSERQATELNELPPDSILVLQKPVSSTRIREAVSSLVPQRSLVSTAV